MRPLLYLMCCFLLLCFPLLGGHRDNPESARQPAIPLRSGIETDDSFPVRRLVEDVFIAGACNTITNIRGIGDKKGIGYFQNGGASIGIDRGVIISTGPVGNAEGPNTATDRSGDFHDYNGDPDLDLMATGPVKDAVGIEFDFMPLDSIVTFKYVFASEEYCEFVGSIYNDVFGFFIQGPGIQGGFSNGARNVALIPGTEDFVSINSVNFQQNEGYYIRNELPDDAELCGLPPGPGNFHSQVEYDGFTRLMTAVLHLQPCQTYHIRLVVADVGDNFYDSAVFLAAESFNLGGKVEISAGTGASPENPSREGCQDAYFVFERPPGSNQQFPLTVNYTVSPISTAVAAADFVPLPGSATIPAGQPSVLAPVNLINDGLPEPVESLVLELDIPCACYTDTARMFIADSPPVAVRLDDFGLCENGSATIRPAVQGGTAPFAYAWNTGGQGPSLNVSAGGPPLYAVTVYDACGNSASDSATYFLAQPPEAALSGQASICEGDTALLPVALQGNPPWSIAYSLDGVPQPEITGINNPGFHLPASLPGTYALLGVWDAACEGYASGQAGVEVRRITLEAERRHVSCPDAADGAILVEITGGIPPFQHHWRENIGNSLSPQGLAAGTYHLSVTDGSGCGKEMSFEIEAPPPLEPLKPDCILLAEGRLALDAAGGTPPYLYSLDGDAFFSDALFNGLEPGRQYYITIQDAAGCLLSQDFIMPAPYDGQMVALPEQMEAAVGRRILLQPGLFIPESLIGAIRWTPATGLSCADCLHPELIPVEDRTYTLRIVDIYGCTAETSVKIKVENKAAIYVPTAFSPNGDHINDRFTVYANTFQVEEIAAFRVFDRWGNLVYERKGFLPNDESAGWDGAARGKPLSAGVYAYMVEVKLVNGGRQLAGGHVVLVR